MAPRFAARMGEIAPFHVMELLRRASELERSGCDVIHMEVGEPDFPTPEPVLEAAQRFLAAGRVAYTPALGLPALREAISAFYAERLGADVAPDRIVITAGASGALVLALGITTDPGDEWLLPDPSYPCNRHLVRTFEGRVRLLPVGPETAFQPTAAMIAAACGPRTRGVMLASPANPTGTLLSLDEIDAITEAAAERGAITLVDEIYQGLTYGVPMRTILSRRRDVLVVNSFSKYFGMTGWRLGWLVLPDADWVREAEKLAQHLFISPSTVAQHAALAAFLPQTQDELERRRAEFARRRAVLLRGLDTLGLTVPAEPTGAFYAYADVSALGETAERLAQRFIEEAYVAVTPGRDFGEHRADQFLRFAYTTTQARIAAAIERLAKVLRR
ncbi:pyridoxal phosphate-dependent aminotransferase [Tepidiphilus sp. HLB4]